MKIEFEVKKQLLFFFSMFILPLLLPAYSIAEGKNEMVLVKGGCYEMGDTFGDGDWPERPVHRACVDDFYLGKYEVTNQEFADFLNAYGGETTKEGEKIIHLGGAFKGERCRVIKIDGKYSVEKGYEKHPVIYVTWYGISAYARYYGLRLPTETEWEFAARERGKKIKYVWGNGHPGDKKMANIPDESVLKKIPDWNVLNWEPWEGYDDGYPLLSPVGSFEPNSLGLYDLTGNVWEWCVDLYDNKFYRKKVGKNPKSVDGETYVMRGGSWLSQLFELRLSARARHYPDAYHATWGFRVAGPPPK
ncbi:MAG: formylglycine-generating enzyme family protein [Nitrospinota bacterium]